MPTVISQPTRVEAAGNKPKLIDEYIGRVNSATTGVSVAHMRSPEGWVEPGQTPDFDEYTLVLKGNAARGTSRREASMFRRVRRLSPTKASGSATVRRSREARSTSRSVVPAFSIDTVHRTLTLELSVRDPD